MRTLSLKLPVELDAMLVSAAQQAGTTKSAVAREALKAFFEDGSPASSCLALARDLAGSVDGPPDLSVGKRHFAGYGG